MIYPVARFEIEVPGVFMLADGRMVRARVEILSHKLTPLIERALQNATRSSSSWSDGAVIVLAEVLDPATLEPVVRAPDPLTVAAYAWSDGALGSPSPEVIERARELGLPPPARKVRRRRTTRTA